MLLPKPKAQSPKPKAESPKPKAQSPKPKPKAELLREDDAFCNWGTCLHEQAVRQSAKL